MYVKGWARRERYCRSLSGSILPRSEDLSTHYSLAIKVLSQAELRKADSSFEQAALSNIQYLGTC